MVSLRMERVQRLLRSEISSIILRKLKDPRVGMVTVTEVDASPDLKTARIFFTVMGHERDDEAAVESLAGLRSAAGFIRSELMRVLHLRPMPALEFEMDRSLEQGMRTLDLLDQIRDEHEHEEPSAEADDSANRDE